MGIVVFFMVLACKYVRNGGSCDVIDIGSKWDKLRSEFEFEFSSFHLLRMNTVGKDMNLCLFPGTMGGIAG